MYLLAVRRRLEAVLYIYYSPTARLFLFFDNSTCGKNVVMDKGGWHKSLSIYLPTYLPIYLPIYVIPIYVHMYKDDNGDEFYDWNVYTWVVHLIMYTPTARLNLFVE